MNRIDEMLRELCPDGVEYRPLGEVASIRTGAKPSVLEDCGRFSYVNGGVKESGRTQESNARGGVVTIPSRGSVGIASYQFSDFWLGPLCYEVRADVGLMEARFLFHFLKSVERSLIALQQTGSIPALNKKELIGFKVPVPPLEIQREIVRILDSFTELEVELEVELEARRKQYVFYRDQLLNFESAREAGRTSVLGLPPFEVLFVPLGTIVEVRSGWGFPKAKQGVPGGEIPFYKVSDMNLGSNRVLMSLSQNYVSREVSTALGVRLAPSGTVIFPKIGAALRTNKKRLLSMESAYDNNIMGLIPSECMNSKFLYYWFQGVELSSLANDSGALPSIRKSDVEKFLIPLPPLDVQHRIADVLDSFGALVNDLSSGLPAEIAARRKQYEYYRDKLLTFPEKK